MISSFVPKVSVVIPVYNGHETLPACLDSVMGLDFPRKDMEIIVVDNNSTDKTKNIIQEYPVRYLFEPNRGRGWARNKGVKNAKAEFIAFIDSDCIADKNWLSVLFEGINLDNDIAACGGLISSYKTDTILEEFTDRSRLLCQESSIAGGESGWDLPRFITANAICRKKCIQEVGYFDNDLITSEDTEISWRFSIAGYEIRYIPEAIIYHRNIRSFRKFCRHHFEYGKSHALLFHKYDELFTGKNIESYKGNKLVFVVYRLYRVAALDIKSCLKIMKEMNIKILPIFLMRTLVHFFGLLLHSFTLLREGYKNRKKYNSLFSGLLGRNLVIYNNSTCWNLNDNISWFLNNNRIKIAAFKGFRFYTLNGIGTEIWNSFTSTNNLKTTRDHISLHYDIPKNKIDDDIYNFIKEMEREGIFSQK